MVHGKPKAEKLKCLICLVSFIKEIQISNKRFENLNSLQLAEELKKAHIAYFSIGSLEHHGLHLPVGFDAMWIHQACLAAIGMITEEGTTGKIEEIYSEIMANLGIDFIPNMYKVMAVNHFRRNNK